ncbi:MAG: acetylornithine deacetylase [Sulfitobacter sp.]
MTQTLDILERLVGFDTVSSKSNLALIDFAQGFLATRGFDVHRVPDKTGQKAGLFAVLGPAGPGGILLSGHIDVVPVDGQKWSSDPFQLTQKDGRAYGRGTTDMKGYVASVLAMADRASRAKLSEPLKIALSYDEEIGCLGIQNMIGCLQRTIGLPRACLIGEPTEMQVAIGHKGKAALVAQFHGVAGHSSLAPKFVNALHLAVDFTSELRRLQEDFAQNGARDAAYDVPYTTLHVGKLSGGTALNIVPDYAEMTFEYRHLAEDSPSEIFDEIIRAAARVETDHQRHYPQAKIEIDQYNTYPGLNVDETAMVSVLAKRLSQTNGVIKVAYGTEAGFFDALNIPTVVCGPGSMEGQGHKADEYVTLEQLHACDTMLARVLDELTA